MKIHLSETEFLKAELKRLQDDMQALAAQQEHEPENEPYVSLASVQPVQATMKLESSGPGHGPAPNQKLSVRHVTLIDAGKTAAQPAPVQKRPQNCGTGYCSCVECVMEPAPVQPVAWMSASRFEELQKGFTVMTTLTKQRAFEDDVAIHTTPPAAQRQWVGLTEQERNDIEDYCEMIVGKPAFEVIEAKLKEKNT